MLKRITESLTTTTVDQMNNDFIYTVPTLDERQKPGMDWDSVVKEREKEIAFEGDFKCNLCPKKVLRREKDLNEHLMSKGHKLALARFYKKNQPKLRR